MDPTSILVDNLIDALRQVNRYLSLGLISAVSAFVLDRQVGEGSVSVPFGFVAMSRDSAKLVLVGLSFVAGMLAYVSADGATGIAGRLQANGDLLEAVCTYSSVATAPLLIRVGAAALPIAFLTPILLRARARIKEVSQEDSRGVLATLGFLILPYLAFGMTIVRLPCD